MIEVATGLFVSDQSACFYDERDEWAVIHACVEPCYNKAVEGLSGDKPEGEQLLVIERGRHLYLNLVDPERPRVAPLLIERSLAFIRANLPGTKVLIHCNDGDSRAPSLALVYMAAEGQIANGTFDEASDALTALYPDYNPGAGIFANFTTRWADLIGGG